MTKKTGKYEMIDTSYKRELTIKSIIFFFLLTIIGSLSIYVAMATRNPNKKPAFVNLNSENQSTAPVQKPVSPQKYALSSKTKDSKKIVSGFDPPRKETIYFSFDDTKIMPAELSKLQSFWSDVKKRKGSVTIEGHADDIGSEEYNQELSNLRAKVVAIQLQQLGMDNQYIVTIRGSGETQPVAKTNSQHARAINRRVVISFQY